MGLVMLFHSILFLFGCSIVNCIGNPPEVDLLQLLKGQPKDIGMADGQWNSTWTMEPRHLCPTTTTTHCSCLTHNPHHLLINCSCQDPNQIVTLEGGVGLSFPMGMSLVIENCSHVRIQPHAFSSIDGSLLDIQFKRIGHLELAEYAFDLNPQIVERNIYFKNVSMGVIPGKGFPSSLSIISFIQSHIGLISPSAFKGKSVQRILFQDSRLDKISSEAFHEEILINNSWTVERCVIGWIQERGIASSITNMTWRESEIGQVESWAMSGIIPSASFISNNFNSVQSNGLTLKEWTYLQFINNSFQVVGPSGIDLSLHSAQFNHTLLQGNSWKEIGVDWIRVGPGSPTPYTLILQNRLLHPCSCASTFIPQLTVNGSSGWFREDLSNNSQCLTTPRGGVCLGRQNDGSADPDGLWISYSDWPLLCSESTFLCLNELSEVEVTPTPELAARLRLLVIIIGTVGLAIALSLIAVFCVYLCKREGSREEKDPVHPGGLNGFGGSQGHSLQNSYPGYHSRTEGVHKVNGESVFEDVEMEDKGVQTIPSELSNQVLEGLRDKLTHPDSFWDAKETIDHLYDLIHVRGDPVPTPPDVTVLFNGQPNGQRQVFKESRSTSTSTFTPHKVPSHPPPIRSSSLAQGQEPNGPRYAQIRSKPKAATLLRTDYPLDLPPPLDQVYAQLGQGEGHPTMCDYTEPKDVQTHVYAELSSFPTHIAHVPHVPGGGRGGQGAFLHGNKTFCVQRPRPMGRLTTPPTVPVHGEEKEGKGPGSHQRPLPSIPPPFSTSTLK